MKGSNLFDTKRDKSILVIPPLIDAKQECHHKASAAKPFILILALWWHFCFFMFGFMQFGFMQFGFMQFGFMHTNHLEIFLEVMYNMIYIY